MEFEVSAITFSVEMCMAWTVVRQVCLSRFYFPARRRKRFQSVVSADSINQDNVKAERLIECRGRLEAFLKRRRSIMSWYYNANTPHSI